LSVDFEFAAAGRLSAEEFAEEKADVRQVPPKMTSVFRTAAARSIFQELARK